MQLGHERGEALAGLDAETARKIAMFGLDGGK